MTGLKLDKQVFVEWSGYYTSSCILPVLNALLLVIDLLHSSLKILLEINIEVVFSALPTMDVYIRPVWGHSASQDVYIRPQTNEITNSPVVQVMSTGCWVYLALVGKGLKSCVALIHLLRAGFYTTAEKKVISDHMGTTLQ